MLIVTFLRSESGLLNGFKALGHTGYSTSGTDIVCAGASALIQTAAIGITDHLGLNASVVVDDGQMELSLPSDLGSRYARDADLILNTIRLGLEQISEQYPEFLCVKY